jgi:hypothetical protein
MPQQANADQTGIAEGLKNRVQQSAAIAAMRDNEEHPKEKPAYVPPAGDPNNPKTRYGAHPERGENRIDVTDWIKPLPTQKKYHKGVSSVPETGPAILKKGEKVIPAEENPDNPDNKGEHMSDKGAYHHDDYSPTEKSEFHRSMSSLHQGGLHRALGIGEGEKIPMAKIEAATHSENGHTRKMAVMAKSMHSWRHGK